MSENPSQNPSPPTIVSVEFFFDPGCPWTWATSRWLVEAAAARQITIEWRSLSLGVLNAGREIPEEYRSLVAAGVGAHRLFAALRDAGRNDLVAAVYTEWGRRVHHDAEPPRTELVRAVALSAGAGDWLDAIDDPSWDAVVEASTHEALDLAGPDIGSPVIAFGEPRFGIFGPIVSPPPIGDDGLRLLDLVLTSETIPGFFEIKRGRTTGPLPGARP